jgi:hypothetical protein
MRQAMKMLVWGLAGVLVTGGIVIGTLGIARKGLASPSRPVRMVAPSLVSVRSNDVRPSAHPLQPSDGSDPPAPTDGAQSEQPRSSESEPVSGDHASAEDD